MKRAIFMVAFAIVASLSMTSCYSSKVLVGNVEENTPVIEVNSRWNHTVLFGLIPISATQKGADFVGNRSNYAVKTTHSFVNMLVQSLTFGLYNPTTTKYYIPANLDE